MPACWKRDKSWSDKYTPEIVRLIAPHVIREAPLVEDQSRNTDLIVLSAGDTRIACRVRRPGGPDSWLNEFTIRTSRPSGTATELAKVIQGWGDLMFYGHAALSPRPTFRRWMLLDLGQFRLSYARMLLEAGPGRAPGMRKENHDGSSDFTVFNVRDFPSSLVVAEGANDAPQLEAAS